MGKPDNTWQRVEKEKYNVKLRKRQLSYFMLLVIWLSQVIENKGWWKTELALNLIILTVYAGSHTYTSSVY